MAEEQINDLAIKHCDEVLCSVCENRTCTELIKCFHYRARRAGFYCGYEQATKKQQEEIADLQLGLSIRAEDIENLQKQIEKMKSDVVRCFGDEYNVLVAKLLEEWKLKE